MYPKLMMICKAKQQLVGSQLFVISAAFSYVEPVAQPASASSDSRAR